MALSDNLQAWWALDEASGDAVDSHTNGLTLTDVNTVGSASGESVGTGVVRDFERDNSERFSRTSEAALQVSDTDFAFCFWTKPESFASNWGLVSKYGGTANEYGLLGDASGALTWRVVTSGGTINVVATTFGALNTATWYMLFMNHVASADTIGISVNAGTIDTNATSGDAPNSSDGTFQVGAHLTNRYDGMVALCGFWRGGFPDGTGQTQLYNSGSGLTYSALGGGSSAVVVIVHQLMARGASREEAEHQAREIIERRVAKMAARRRDQISFGARNRWVRDNRTGVYLPPANGIVTPRWFVGRAAA